MKKIIAIAAVLTLVFSFAACGKKVSDTNMDVTSEAGDKKSSYDNLAAAFELTSEEYGIAFRKGSDLTAEVNKYIDEMDADGSLQAIADKYDIVLTENAEPKSNDAVNVSDIEYIKSKGKMIIGITDYEPMNYQDEKGEWTGFDTEFAEAVCEKLGVKAEFMEIDWDNKFIALESKSIDCIWNGMTISDEVLKNTSCTKAYAKNAQVVVLPKDKLDKYKTAEDMKELSVAVEAGSAGSEAATDNGIDNIVEVTAQTDALLEAASGSCDACIIDLTMAQAVLGK
ncbi:MAG: transporter substrate-binding domain-containing protein [Clostridia bacterium]|nr:transporter substrate-binding domain-containing protein [Clostridia bacterium]